MKRWCALLVLLCAAPAAADPVDDALKLLKPIRLPSRDAAPLAIECRYRFVGEDQPAHIRISYEGPKRYSVAAFAPNGVPVLVATEKAIAYVDEKLRLRIRPHGSYVVELQIDAKKDRVSLSFKYMIDFEEGSAGLDVRIDLSALRESVIALEPFRFPDGRVRLYGRSKSARTPIAVMLRPGAKPALERLAMGGDKGHCRLRVLRGDKAARAARVDVDVDAIRPRWKPIEWPADKKKVEEAQARFLGSAHGVGTGLLVPVVRQRIEGMMGISLDWKAVERAHDANRKVFGELLAVLPDPRALKRDTEALARVGHLEALAVMWIRGAMEPDGGTEFLEWVTKSAEAEMPLAQRGLGVALIEGEFGATRIPANPKFGLVWLRCAAWAGNADAMGVLAEALVERDPVEAYAWTLVLEKHEPEETKGLREKLERKLDGAQREAARARAGALRSAMGLPGPGK